LPKICRTGTLLVRLRVNRDLDAKTSRLSPSPALVEARCPQCIQLQGNEFHVGSHVHFYLFRIPTLTQYRDVCYVMIWRVHQPAGRRIVRLLQKEKGGVSDTPPFLIAQCFIRCGLIFLNVNGRLYRGRRTSLRRVCLRKRRTFLLRRHATHRRVV